MALPLAAQAQSSGEVITKQYNDGSVYEGTFVDGKQDGTGTYTLLIEGRVHEAADRLITYGFRLQPATVDRRDVTADGSGDGLVVQAGPTGGVAQGFGQAVMEQAAYDGQGQLLSGSFMDYAIPRAADLPFIRFASEPSPTRTNPFGMKGCGEAGAIGSPPAVINAVLDALHPLGVRDLDMPASPHRVWSAIDAAATS